MSRNIARDADKGHETRAMPHAEEKTEEAPRTVAPHKVHPLRATHEIGGGSGQLIGEASGRHTSVGDLSTMNFEMAEYPDRVQVRLTCPGVAKEELHVEVRNGMLNVSCERAADRQERGTNWAYQLHAYGQTMRSIKLPDRCQEHGITTARHNGGYDICIPRKKME